MSIAPLPRAPDPLNSPAFIVGVTGSMKVDSEDQAFREQVGLVFDWLQAEPGEMAPHPVLGTPLGLKKTPIVVLSALAPGADQLVAGVAMARGWRVVAPLPFPNDLYRDASTFCRGERDEDAARQRQFDAMVVQVGVQNCFPVLIESDLRLSVHERQEVWRRDRESRPARNLRYRAAGEYVAAYCDLLISLSDYGPPATKPSQTGGQSRLRREAGSRSVGTAEPAEVVIGSGAKVIIEAKRRGLTPGLLPVTPAVNWADNGPVVNIFVRDPATVYDSEPPPNATLTLLHPYDCRPAGRPDAPNHDQHWQWAGTDILRGVAANLEQLNREASRTGRPREDAALRTMIGGPILPPEEGRPLGLEGTPLARLDTIARVRRRVADQNSFYDARVRHCLVLFICLALLTLVSLQIYENWVHEPLGPTVLAEETPEWRGLPLLVAMASTCFAWLAFRRFRKSSLDDRQNDYRAVAEGLRVQFYWMVAGTGQSAASDYLQRQRSELSWVRSAISSVSFPYESTRDWFEGLPAASKLEVFAAIREGWIGDQLRYFRQRTADVATCKHSLHFLRNALLSAGLTVLVGLAAIELIPSAEAFAAEHSTSLMTAALAGLGVLVGSWVVEWACCLVRKNRSGAACPLPRRPPALHFWQVCQPFCWGGGPGAHEEGREAVADRLNACLAVLVGWLLATLFVALAFTLPGSLTWLPGPHRILAILKNLCLGGGGLVHLWITLRFLGENLRRYDAMSSLFQAADVRMEKHLEDLTAQIHGGPPGETTGTIPPDSIGAADTIRHLQSLCLALGKEALAENAEWLLMHRDRRLRPVMPG